MSFPKRVYKVEEVAKARAFIEKGWMHRLETRGSLEFEKKVKESLELVRTAEYYDFLRTYIREIVEIEGFSQLREAEVAVWIDKVTLVDPVDAAGFLIQKAQQMKDFLEDKPYFGGQGEKRAINKRLEFLEELKKKSDDEATKKRCEEILAHWKENFFP